MKNFYTQIKKTINQTTKNIQYLKKKSDASMLTKNDLSTQNKIISISLTGNRLIMNLIKFNSVEF